jgi:hypothetical protein
MGNDNAPQDKSHAALAETKAKQLQQIGMDFRMQVFGVWQQTDPHKEMCHSSSPTLQTNIADK